MNALVPDSGSRRPRRWILWLGAFILLGGIAGGALRDYTKRARAADLAGAPLLRGVAKVEMLVVRQGEAMGTRDSAPWAVVRFRGSLQRAPVVTEPERLHEGDDAAIWYRVGRSGRVYVEQAAPVER